MKTRKLAIAVALSALWFGESKAVSLTDGDPGGDALTTVGSFDGFFHTSRAFDSVTAPVLRGTLTLKVTDVSRGKLTAHVVLQGGPLNFNGTAWETTESNGTKRVTLNGRGRNKATLTLNVREKRIWGSLEGDGFGETLILDGARNEFIERATTNAVQAQITLDTYRGYYTVALPLAAALSTGDAEADPQGVGYLTLTVGNRGAVKVAGQLADGTGMSLSSQLILFTETMPSNIVVDATNTTEYVTTHEACIPIFKALNAKTGWFSALLWLRNGEARIVVTERDLGWYARWENPGSFSRGNSINGKHGADGFQMLLDACGGYYSSVSALASNYLFSADEPTGLRYYSGSGVGDYMAEAIPSGIVVTVTSGKLRMPIGSNPPVSGGVYDYSGTNAAQATIVATARTGLFKGMFNIYSDYESNGRLVHKKDRVSYAGVLTPMRDEIFADMPVGMGFYLVRDADPTFRAYNLKRSFPVELEQLQ